VAVATDAQEGRTTGGFARLRNLLNRLTDPTPPRHEPDTERDWLPPVLNAGDMTSLYLLTMADRETAWYFDRR
jgi:hypothetical protein